jgi:hypothetical protein
MVVDYNEIKQNVTFWYTKALDYNEILDYQSFRARFRPKYFESDLDVVTKVDSWVVFFILI